MQLSELFGLERPGDDADHLAACSEDGICDSTHHADLAAAMDQAPVPRNELAGEILGCLPEGWVATRTRAAEDAETEARW